MSEKAIEFLTFVANIKQSYLPEAEAELKKMEAAAVDEEERKKLLSHIYYLRNTLYAAKAIFIACGDYGKADLTVLLEERYFNCKSWYEIASIMEFGTDYVSNKLNRIAIRRVSFLLNNPHKIYSNHYLDINGD